MTHLLVTNDFPPKVGGIQAYLWELWRRLDPDTFAVLTATLPSRRRRPSTGARPTVGSASSGLPAGCWRPPPAWSGGSGTRPAGSGPTWWCSTRSSRSAWSARAWASPTPCSSTVRRWPSPVGSRPAASWWPTCSATASWPSRPAAIPAAEAARAVRGGAMPPVVEIPPGVDLERFRPLSAGERARGPADLGLPADGPLVVSVSRLVPRKGMDVLIDAAVRLRPDVPDLTVAIAGRGRDSDRLAGRVAEYSAPVRLLGGVSDADLPRLVGAADVFAMLCRNRWLGLEQEGFGIVFLEAAAAGVPQVAGRSGGAGEAVEDGVTGLVVRRSDRCRLPPPGPSHELLGDRGPASSGWARRHGTGPRHPSTMTNSPLGWPRRSPTWKAEAPSGHDAGRQTDRGGGLIVAEQATERMVVSATPARCFEVSSDIEAYPQWAADIKEVTIESRDDQGRPELVTFRCRGLRAEHQLHPGLRLQRGPRGAVLGADPGRHHLQAGRPLRLRPRRRRCAPRSPTTSRWR